VIVPLSPLAVVLLFDGEGVLEGILGGDVGVDPPCFGAFGGAGLEGGAGLPPPMPGGGASCFREDFLTGGLGGGLRDGGDFAPAL